VAQSGNGIDLAAIYQLLTAIAGRLDGHEGKLNELIGTTNEHSRRFDRIDRRLDGIDDRLDEHTGKLNQLVGTVNDHNRRFDQMAAVLNDHSRKLDDLTFSVTDLRAAVTNYHNTVLGHGIRLTNLDERVRRIERHLKLEPVGK
jgi:ABC-type transporter Mla subunit MlaD